MTIDDILSQNTIIPVLNLADKSMTLDLVSALVEGGIQCIEIALRTDFALQAIEIARNKFPTLIVGAGTLRRPEDFSRVSSAGAQFAVSPGFTPGLLEAANNWELAFLPGASSVSEIMRLVDAGYRTIKLFPAAEVGGVNFIKAISGPLPDIKILPSGGVSGSNFLDYLSLPGVISVSGSWLTPKDLVADNRWSEITQLVKENLVKLSDGGLRKAL